jgi:hypothetical protein
MKTFSGWRAVGRAMRWARQQDGVECRREDEGVWITHIWRSGDPADHVELGGAGTLAYSLTIDLADGRYIEGVHLPAAEILRVLAALDLIPAELAAGTWFDQAVERFGEPFIAIPEAVIRPGLNRRCWGWFVDGHNYNLAIDQEDTGFRTTGGSPYRHARIWTSAEPTDAEIRSVLDLAWPGFRSEVAR